MTCGYGEGIIIFQFTPSKYFLVGFEIRENSKNNTYTTFPIAHNFLSKIQNLIKNQNIVWTRTNRNLKEQSPVNSANGSEFPSSCFPSIFRSAFQCVVWGCHEPKPVYTNNIICFYFHCNK